ncbi:MAG: hypothetical protein GT598_09570 [Bacteroidales bacterium]|nr:hypothetical protein [Bacteroidales bacterium]HPM17908.1 hypothetical protein [Bacteroidales bacterium]HQG78581.1 hypothetical protein [Bacteroidales bacterium]
MTVHKLQYLSNATGNRNLLQHDGILIEALQYYREGFHPDHFTGLPEWNHQAIQP